MVMGNHVESWDLDNDGFVSDAMAMIPKPGRMTVLTREELAQLLAVAWAVSQEDLAAAVCTGNPEVLASLYEMVLKSGRRSRDVILLKELVREFAERRVR